MHLISSQSICLESLHSQIFFFFFFQLYFILSYHPSRVIVTLSSLFSRTVLFSVLKSIFSDNIHLPTPVCWNCDIHCKCSFTHLPPQLHLEAAVLPSYSIHSVRNTGPIVLKILYLVYSSCSWPGSGGKNFTARRSIVVFGPRRKVGHFTKKPGVLHKHMHILFANSQRNNTKKA